MGPWQLHARAHAAQSVAFQVPLCTDVFHRSPRRGTRLGSRKRMWRRVKRDILPSAAKTAPARGAKLLFSKDAKGVPDPRP